LDGGAGEAIHPYQLSPATLARRTFANQLALAGHQPQHLETGNVQDLDQRVLGDEAHIRPCHYSRGGYRHSVSGGIDAT
jgi:hypothetical protein